MKNIVRMCQEIGVHTLAEGVETQAHYQFLEEIGCELVQGFYFFRPEPVDAVISSIKT